MADNDDMENPDRPSAKAIAALLREARSLSRRADKLGRTAATTADDTTTQQLSAAACTSMEQLVHHLTVCSNAKYSDTRRRRFVEKPKASSVTTLALGRTQTRVEGTLSRSAPSIHVSKPRGATLIEGFRDAAA